MFEDIFQRVDLVAQMHGLLILARVRKFSHILFQPLGYGGLAAGEDALQKGDIFPVSFDAFFGVRIKIAPFSLFKAADAETSFEFGVFARPVVQGAGRAGAFAIRKCFAE